MTGKIALLTLEKFIYYILLNVLYGYIATNKLKIKNEDVTSIEKWYFISLLNYAHNQGDICI